MTGVGLFGNGVLWIARMGMLNASVSVAKYETYGPIVSQRVWARAEKRMVEEALLNLRIEAAVDGIVPKGCGADLKLDRDRQLLDPQLPTSNCAGVPHLGGWGCEQGAVCCSPGAMIAVDETPSTGSCGVQDSVPFGVGDAVPAENPRARSC